MQGCHPMHLITFSDQRRMASAFMRFQEHYESPFFQGKIFTRDECIERYAREGGEAADYLSFWDGFNVPSTVFAPFRDGAFDPLTDDERRLLAIVEGISGPAYVIGAVEGDDKTIAHEIVHGLYHFSPEYREEVAAVLRRFDLEPAREALRRIGGYTEDVFDDEINANALTGWEWIDGLDLSALAGPLTEAFRNRFGFAPDDAALLQDLAHRRPFA